MESKKGEARDDTDCWMLPWSRRSKACQLMPETPSGRGIKIKKSTLVDQRPRGTNTVDILLVVLNRGGGTQKHISRGGVGNSFIKPGQEAGLGGEPSRDASVKKGRGGKCGGCIRGEGKRGVGGDEWKGEGLVAGS